MPSDHRVLLKDRECLREVLTVGTKVLLPITSARIGEEYQRYMVALTLD